MKPIRRLGTHEFRSLMSLFLLNLLTTGGFFIARTAKDALFYSKAGAEMLPWAFIINAIIIFFLGGWIASRQDRLPLKRMMVLAWAVTILCAFGFALFFASDLSERAGIVSFFAFFTFFEIPYLVLLGLFWAFAESYFTEREADTVFPKITAGGHLGTVLAGLLAAFLSAAKLIVVWGVSLFAGLAIILWMWRFLKPEYSADTSVGATSNDGDVGSGVAAGLQAVLRHRYAVLFLFITFSTFFVMSIFDYSLADTFGIAYGSDTDKLTRFMGYIVTGFGVFAFVFQLWAIPKITKKLSVPDANLIAPSLLTLGGLILLSAYTFISAAVARGLFLVNEFVFNQTLLPFIYGAVPVEDRTHVRSTIEGTVTNVALGAAGLFLLLPAQVHGFRTHWLGMVAFIAALGMLGLSFALRFEYNRIRASRFARGDSSGRARYLESLARLGDKELDAELNRALLSRNTADVTMSLELTGVLGRQSLLTSVLTHVNDKDDSVRSEALRTVAKIIGEGKRFQDFRKTVTVQNDVSAGGFRCEDLRTLEAIGQVYLAAGQTGRLGSDFAYLLDAPGRSPSVRALAMRYIFKSGTVSHIRQAADRLDTALRSNDPDENRVAAEVLTELSGEANLGELIRWAEQGATKELQATALRAVAKVAQSNARIAETIFNLLLRKLGQPGVAEVALEGAGRVLSSYPFLLTEVQYIWESGEKDPKDRSPLYSVTGPQARLPELIAVLDSTDAEDLLVRMILEGDFHVFRYAFSALEQMVRRRGALSEGNKERCTSIRQQLYELLALYGTMRQRLSMARENRELARRSLGDRIDEVSRLYFSAIWLSVRNQRNGKQVDPDIEDLQAKNVLIRDKAMKSLEIVLEDARDVYLEMSDMVDALDFRKGEVERDEGLSGLARKAQYAWESSVGSTQEERLFRLKEDPWLQWVFRENQEILDGTDLHSLSDAELGECLAVMGRLEAFEAVPVELLGVLMLRSKPTHYKAGERLVWEGKAQQGGVIIVEGEIAVVGEHELWDSIPAPAVFGMSEALAGKSSSLSIRAATDGVKAVAVDQAVLDRWLIEFPQAATAIARAMAQTVNRLNDEARKFYSEHEGSSELCARLEQIHKAIDKLTVATPVNQPEKRQRRFLVSLEIEESELARTEGVVSQRLEQYYLVVDRSREVRLRKRGDQDYTITLKGGPGENRAEVSVEVDGELYDEMRAHNVGHVIGKTRYSFGSGQNKGWLIDVFDAKSPLSGLVIAEIELSRDEIVPSRFPASINLMSDISNKPEYENRNLALCGLPDSFFVEGQRRGTGFFGRFRRR